MTLTPARSASQSRKVDTYDPVSTSNVVLHVLFSVASNLTGLLSLIALLVAPIIKKTHSHNLNRHTGKMQLKPVHLKQMKPVHF